MRAAPTQEVGREQPQTKEAYLELFEREWSEIHEGPMPETGLMEKGRPERKAACEDVKLKNRERGLFLVADGVSKSEGWFASREAARIMYEKLGQELDRGIENNLQEVLRNNEAPLDRITRYVAAQMVGAIQQADKEIRARVTGTDIGVSSTTLSLAKLVELPNGRGEMIQRMFFANVGDSRIYVKSRDGKLRQISVDDNLLTVAVEAKRITAEQARQIDQAPDMDRLPPELKERAERRNIITKSIGYGEIEDELPVSYLDLQPGDRVVLVSDGVSDQLLEERMARIVDRNSSDTDAERVLQQAAMDMSLDGKDPRAKEDDISALVHTITERGPDRGYVRNEHQVRRTKESLKETLPALRANREAARKEVERLQAVLDSLEPMTLKRERLAILMSLEKAKGVEQSYIYHLEKTNLDLVDEELPPRFQTGEEVQVWREDFDPPSLDRQMWTVISYDPTSKEYDIRGPGRSSRKISRYALEDIQNGLMVRVGDELPAVNEIGAREKGFQVVAFDRDGSVVLAKEKDGVIKRVRAKAEDVEDSFSGLMYLAEQSRNRMVKAAQGYHESVQAEAAHRDSAEAIARIESRQRAIDLANEDIERINQIRREIHELKRLLDEHGALERRQRDGALPQKDEMRRRLLAVWAHGNRQTRSLSQQLEDKQRELEDLQRKKSS